MADHKSGLWYRCMAFVEEQSAGEWDQKTIVDDADKLMAFVTAEIRAADNAAQDQLTIRMGDELTDRFIGRR
jgi:hypothetical protein